MSENQKVDVSRQTKSISQGKQTQSFQTSSCFVGDISPVDLNAQNSWTTLISFQMKQATRTENNPTIPQQHQH